MENPNPGYSQPCPIQKCNLSLDDLKDLHGFLVADEGVPYDTADLEDTVENHMLVRAPESSAWRRVYRVKPDLNAKDSDDIKDYQLNVFEGHVSRGIIFIESVYRRPAAGAEGGPRCSQIAQAAYEATYPIESLKHIVVADVVNKETKKLIKRLYAQEDGISWRDEDLFEWKYDSPEFKAILGTKIGSIAAYIVLGSFQPGTHRISRVMTTSHYSCLYMRFDVEPICTGLGIFLEPPLGKNGKRGFDDYDEDGLLDSLDNEPKRRCIHHVALEMGEV